MWSIFSHVIPLLLLILSIERKSLGPAHTPGVGNHPRASIAGGGAIGDHLRSCPMQFNSEKNGEEELETNTDNAFEEFCYKEKQGNKRLVLERCGVKECFYFNYFITNQILLINKSGTFNILNVAK